MRKLFFGLIFLFPFINLPGQDISFYKENITMKIDIDRFYVTGIYYLKTDSSKTGTLLYPFPEGMDYGVVDSIYIYNLTASQPIIPMKTESSHLVFKIDFMEFNELEIRIAYQQELRSNRAEYILITTINWHKPLQSANYQLIVPSRINVNRFSILPQDSVSTDTETVYYWEKRNYMPDKNFIFDFTVK